MKRLPGWCWSVVLVLAMVAGGCGEAEPEVQPAEAPGALDGLSPEQIRARAEPMSPAMAESLGIVDTTIHIESPYPAADTLFGRPDTAVADSVP